MSSIGYERGDHITKDSGSKLSDFVSKATQGEMSEHFTDQTVHRHTPKHTYQLRVNDTIICRHAKSITLHE